ncbi:unnamed protein product, partial [Mesorhabditis spiculigera]
MPTEPMTSLKLRIPTQKVGYLIGYHGETIRRITREFGLQQIYVEKHDCPDAPEMREVTLYGPAAAIERATPQVIEITSERSLVWMKLSTEGAGPSLDTIKDIMARTYAQIDLSRDEQDGKVLCKIIGSWQAIADTRRELELLCAEAPPAPPRCQ